MKEFTKKVWACDFCKKKYFVKHACEKHEKFCFKNPANKHKCFEDCVFLKISKDDEFQVELIGEYHESVRGRKAYKCTAHNNMMFTCVAERKGTIDYLRQDHGDDIFRMPAECSDYKYKY